MVSKYALTRLRETITQLIKTQEITDEDIAGDYQKMKWIKDRFDNITDKEKIEEELGKVKKDLIEFSDRLKEDGNYKVMMSMLGHNYCGTQILMEYSKDYDEILNYLTETKYKDLSVYYSDEIDYHLSDYDIDKVFGEDKYLGSIYLIRRK